MHFQTFHTFLHQHTHICSLWRKKMAHFQYHDWTMNIFYIVAIWLCDCMNCCFKNYFLLSKQYFSDHKIYDGNKWNESCDKMARCSERKQRRKNNTYKFRHLYYVIHSSYWSELYMRAKTQTQSTETPFEINISHLHAIESFS